LEEKEAKRKGLYDEFLFYSAQFIQKNWRGFRVRQQVIPYFANQHQAKVKIASLGPVWKTKKIF